MQLTLAGIVILCLWVYAVRRDLASGVILAISLLPFGATAVFNLPAIGGLSLLAAHTTAALTIALALFLFVIDSRQRGQIALPASAVLLIAFTSYGVVASLLAPRIFHHDFLVFSLARETEGGVQLSRAIRSQLVPIEANPSNLSQSAYLILGTGFFLMAYRAARTRGPQLLHKALRLACIVNICLGILDALALDWLLSLTRTANYVIHTQHQVLGLARVIGGFAEASIFGGFSAMMFAYFASFYLDRRSAETGLLAALSGIFAIAAFSSTAYLSMIAVVLLLLARSALDALRFGIHIRTATWVMLIGASALALLIVLVAATPLRTFVYNLFDQLIFSKASSESGIERSAWAEYGFHAFIETYGLGAGLGSLRSNGLVAVMLSNVGVPGALLYLAFLWIVFLRPAARPKRGSQEQAWFRAATTAISSLLVAQFASGTTPDPGMAFFTLSALAVSCTESVRRASATTKSLVERRVAWG